MPRRTVDFVADFWYRATSLAAHASVVASTPEDCAWSYCQLLRRWRRQIPCAAGSSQRPKTKARNAKAVYIACSTTQNYGLRWSLRVRVDLRQKTKIQLSVVALRLFKKSLKSTRRLEHKLTYFRIEAPRLPWASAPSVRKKAERRMPVVRVRHRACHARGLLMGSPPVRSGQVRSGISLGQSLGPCQRVTRQLMLPPSTVT
jgi:hypothetical protein